MHAAIVGAGLMGRWHADAAEAARHSGSRRRRYASRRRPRSWPDASVRPCERSKTSPAASTAATSMSCTSAHPERAHRPRPARVGARLPRSRREAARSDAGRDGGDSGDCATPRGEGEPGAPVPVSKGRPPTARPVERPRRARQGRVPQPRRPAGRGARRPSVMRCWPRSSRTRFRSSTASRRDSIRWRSRCSCRRRTSGSPVVTEGRTSRRSSRCAGARRATSSRSRAPSPHIHARRDLFHGYSIVDRGAPSGVGKLVRPFVLSGRRLQCPRGQTASNGPRVSSWPIRACASSSTTSTRASAGPPLRRSPMEIIASAVLAEAAATARYEVAR